MESDKETVNIYLPGVDVYAFQKLFYNGKYILNKFSMQCFCFNH